MKKSHVREYQFIVFCALVSHFPIISQEQYDFLQENKPVILFQPSDGSLENCMYSPITQQAHTTNFSYDHITIIPKTSSHPTLNAFGMLETPQGDQLFPVGIFGYFSEKLGDTTFYCIFGKKIKEPLENLQEKPL